MARNLGLTQQEVKTRLRFVTEADTTKARMMMGFADTDAQDVNVLIYPISDECHEFRGDLTAFNNKIRTEILGDRVQGVRGILDDLLRRIRPDDTVLVTSDHGFIELLSPDAIIVAQTEAARAERTLQDDVRFRYVKGFHPDGASDAIELQDAAFLDRIHAYLPGWEMPKIRPENYATGYGFLTDYMAEIFSELRRRNFQTHVAAWVDLSGMTGRNQDAIKKTVAGLLKLQHPHRSPETLTRKEIAPLVKVAVEMRKRVTDQLARILPAEFGSVDYSYTLAQE